MKIHSPRTRLFSPASCSAFLSQPRKLGLVASLLLLMGLASCQSSVPLRKTGEFSSQRLLDHPALQAAAEELLGAAQSAISSGAAPDARERWMVSPLVTGDGDWEASVVCTQLATLTGRLQPVQPDGTLSSTAAIQAWLRQRGLLATVWVVTCEGRYRQELRLSLCSGTKSWTSPPVEVSIPADERWTWPFDPKENPSVARVEVGAAESFFLWNGKVYLEDRAGARELRWNRGKRRLSLGDLRPWKDFGRSWITRHVGMPHDLTPALALLRKDVRLVLRDADLPRGEGEVLRWSLDRGGRGMELPLVRASAVEVLGIQAAPPGWDERGTWLVLRQAPHQQATVELFAASLRKLRQPASEEKSPPPRVIRVLTELSRPFGFPSLGPKMPVTHRVELLGPPPEGELAAIARYQPLFPWLSPLELWKRGGESLDAVREGDMDPQVHVVRMCALDAAYPKWVAAAAKGPLALGDVAFWRKLPAAPLYGIARIDPSMPATQRRALAAWLARLGPFELFGLRREDLNPRMPLSGRARSVVVDAATADAAATEDTAAPALEAPDATREIAVSELSLSFCACPGILDPPPVAWRGELGRRLRFLLGDAGWKIASSSVGSYEHPETECDRGQDCSPVGEGWIDLTRLVLPAVQADSLVPLLLSTLGLRETWAAEGTPSASPGAVEEWLLREGYLVPLWSEPGAVFVDRRLGGIRSNPRLVLPDLREAVLLPEKEFVRFGLRR